MVTVKLFQDNKTIVIPDIAEKYEELSDRQYVRVANYIYSSLLIEESIIYILWAISGINRRLFSKLHNHSRQITDDSILDHLNLTDFVFKTSELKDGKSRFFKIGLLQGSKNRLSNIEAYQYAWTIRLIRAYYASKDQKYIDMFCGCIYRLPFVGFNEKFIELWTLISRIFISKKKRRAAFLNYISMNNWMNHKYDAAFSSDDSKILDETESWRKFMHSLSGKVFGKESEVKKSSILSVMTYLDDLNRRAEEALSKK